MQCLEGDAVWKAGDEGLWSRELAAAAVEVGQSAAGRMEEVCAAPALFLLEYNDGFRAALLHLHRYIQEWTYAARIDGQVQATGLTQGGAPYPGCSYMNLNIQEMFLSLEPQYPVERTLLVTGALDALMDSRFRGHVRLETPHLDVCYQAPAKPPIRPTAPRPQGASTVPFEEDVTF